MVEVQVAGLALDKTKTTVVLLKEMNGDRILPIWIGHGEAMAIQAKLAEKPFPRPLTHDLMANLLDTTGAAVVRVEISALKEQTYFATLIVRTASGDETAVDARPSDSIALALRCQAPIFASDELFQTLPSIDMGQNPIEAMGEELLEGAMSEDAPAGFEALDSKRKRKELRLRLRKIDPGEFGSFRLGG
ncbi:MAG: bifunctional nuclease family protein [Candidatus Latescibacteria bacterium]|jgi:hypothetical protein|nr:bifunctional nuclease family protein [Candidatus Latescibacterota bacterium]